MKFFGRFREKSFGGDFHWWFDGRFRFSIVLPFVFGSDGCVDPFFMGASFLGTCRTGTDCEQRVFDLKDR